METAGITEQMASQLLGLGLPGLCIIALAFATYRFYNRNIELTETLITMTKETVKSQEAATAAINRLTDLLRARPPAG